MKEITKPTGAGQVELALLNQRPGPQLEPILELHRAPGAYVTFHRIANGRFENLAALKREDLQSIFPSMRQELERDSYYSLNSFCRPGFGKREIAPGLTVSLPCRRKDVLSHLNAVWLDADYYKAGIQDFGDAYARLWRLQAAREIPTASLIVDSGRGLWALWKLCDPDRPDMPPCAFPEQQRLQITINRAIAEKLVGLGADTQAIDSSRITRFPGSENSKSQSPVRYLVQVGSNGELFTYSLEQLAETLGVPRALPPAPRYIESPHAALGKGPTLPGPARAFTEKLFEPRPGVSEEKRAACRRGWEQRWANLLQDLETLMMVRGGGCEQGCRNRGAYYLAFVLRRCGLPRWEVDLRLQRYGSLCRPPLSKREVWNAVHQAARARALARGRRAVFVSNDRISADLNVTIDEAVRFFTLDASPSLRGTKVAKPTRATKRRALLRQLVEKFGPLTLHAMADKLLESGVQISPMQVHNDYRMLGIKLPPRQGVRRHPSQNGQFTFG